LKFSKRSVNGLAMRAFKMDKMSQATIAKIGPGEKGLIILAISTRDFAFSKGSNAN